METLLSSNPPPTEMCEVFSTRMFRTSSPYTTVISVDASYQPNWLRPPMSKFPKIIKPRMITNILRNMLGSPRSTLRQFHLPRTSGPISDTKLVTFPLFLFSHFLVPPLLELVVKDSFTHFSSVMPYVICFVGHISYTFIESLVVRW